MWLGQSLYSGTVENAARYKVDHNRVTVHGRMTRSMPNAAIEVVDAQGAAGGPTVVLAEVTNNEVRVIPDLPEIEMRGIRVAFAHGTLVANNKVSGAGASAIDVPDYIIEPTWAFAGYGTVEPGQVDELQKTHLGYHPGYGGK